MQTTLASTFPHASSHTVPQTLLLQISTRPRVLDPPCSLTAPWVQPPNEKGTHDQKKIAEI